MLVIGGQAVGVYLRTSARRNRDGSTVRPTAPDHRPTPRLTSEDRTAQVAGTCSDTARRPPTLIAADQRPNSVTPSTYQRSAMLSRIESLMIAAMRGQQLKRSTTASPAHRGLDSGQGTKLSATAGELHTENVRLPFWPA